MVIHTHTHCFSKLISTYFHGNQYGVQINALTNKPKGLWPAIKSIMSMSLAFSKLQPPSYPTMSTFHTIPFSLPSDFYRYQLYFSHIINLLYVYSYFAYSRIFVLRQEVNEFFVFRDQIDWHQHGGVNFLHIDFRCCLYLYIYFYTHTMYYPYFHIKSLCNIYTRIHTYTDKHTYTIICKSHRYMNYDECISIIIMVLYTMN